MTNGNITFYPYVTVTVNNNFVVENISNNTINKIVYFTVKSKDFNYLPFLVLIGGLSALGLYLFFGTEVKKLM
ncbi:MAG: hypothetical protein QXY87_04880 [Saccharolobus sp.]